MGTNTNSHSKQAVGGNVGAMGLPGALGRGSRAVFGALSLSITSITSIASKAPIPPGAIGSLTAGTGRGLAKAESSFLRQVRDCHAALDLGNYSDSDLREAISRIRVQSRLEDTENWLAEVFAITDETIRRRLGAWRFFDPSFDRQNLEVYFRVAQSDQKPPTSPATDLYGWEHWTNGGVERRDRPSVAPLETLPSPEANALDDDEQVIVNTIRQLQDPRRGLYRWDILLSAEFYQALARKDTDKLFHFQATDEQLLAGLYLFQGKIVEMSAGEGKTVAAVFPAVTQALMGRSVHVLTANDYLATRDSNLLAPVYQSLGFTVGSVLGYMDDDERRYAYGKQIVYGTMREFGFDFLRDNLKMSPAEQVQGPLQAAIVDEADQALVDEARTPLIIAGEPLINRRAFNRANKAVADLISLQAKVAQDCRDQLLEETPGSKAYAAYLGRALLADPDNENLLRLVAADPRSYRNAVATVYPDGSDYADETQTGQLYYLVDRDKRFVTLTAMGVELLVNRLGAFYDELGPVPGQTSGLKQEQAEDFPATTGSNLLRKRALRVSLGNQVYQLLRAYLLLEKDSDYVVAEDAVVLIDRYTGRPLPDSRYQEGLHPALEAKESVTVNPDREALAQISVQGFANRYQWLAGMTGTANAAIDEFKSMYSRNVVSVPTVRPALRQDLPSRVYENREDKLAAVADLVRICSWTGRPVLVGVQTVEQSEELHQRLLREGINSRLLNAVTGHDEADIIREAGSFGGVTVATNMAGRGTDIILEPDLDRRVLDRYLALIQDRLDRGSSVVVTCYTEGEADILAGALKKSETFRFTRRRPGKREELVITPAGSPGLPKGERPFIDSCDALEFGLGLCVIGSEFNESPRVALQLKGRSGRQGQFGSTRFLLSWEDRLLVHRGSRPPVWTERRKTDAAGRVYFEGPTVEKFLLRRQEAVEREAAVQRSVILDYAAVSDAHAEAYYAARHRSMAGGISFATPEASCFEYCAALAEGAALRVVERRFPGGDGANYGRRFAGLLAELDRWFFLDGASLRSAALDSLPAQLKQLMVERLESIQSQVGAVKFANLVRLLLLQAGDELWKDYCAGLRSLTVSSRLGNYGHKSAVADYIIHAFDEWQRFQEEKDDLFLSRLLTFPLDRLDTVSPQREKAVELDKSVAKLIS